MKKLLNISYLCMATLLFTTAGCNKDDDDPSDPGPGNIVEVAKADAELTMFAEAVEKAGLSGMLSGGSVTVFAPTNDVFSAYLQDLSYSSVQEWITVTQEKVVQRTLLYHVLPKKYTFQELLTGYQKTKATNDNNDQLDLYIKSGASISFNGNNVLITQTNIEASNGVIHKISGMIEPRTIGGLLEVNSDFSNLLQASSLAQGNIFTKLSQENTSYTMMAPNNAAFNTYFGEDPDINSVSDMATQFGAQGLSDILNYHLLLGNVREKDFSGGPFSTSLGQDLTINTNGSNHTIVDGQGRQVFFFLKNITATNGNVHIISNVLLP